MSRTLSLVAELRTMLAELRNARFSPLLEYDRSAALADKVDSARRKLDDLRQVQRNHKDMEARQREIDRENASH